ncbi:MAG: protein kinase [Proteobacteria bacterium]|nr:protein kinase [Pseudomonadota bacterium]
MKNQNPGSSASQSSSSAHSFLQDSSLITRLPGEQQPTEVKRPEQPPTPAHKQESAPTSGSGGQVTLDFTIRFTDLTFSALLGQGGYGKVFGGEWKFNQVAIKQYTAQDFSEQTCLEIRREAMVMATVSTQSDYLVRLRGMILEKPHYSLVMEYLPGGDLFHLLKSSETLTWPRRYQIGLDMTIGLHHLHEHSVLHRDLKSLNVLLDSGGRAKLADFGLSTLKTSSASTTAGGFKGTILWSAPELFKRGAKATVFSDIYSLGMVLWELASRKIPFADAATPAIAATWVAQGEQEIVPEETPKEFKQLIDSCWDKEPSKRPSASVVAKHLESLLRESKQHDEKTSSREMNLPSSPKSAQASGSNDEEMKKLLAEVMRLKLEQEKDKERLLEMEKKAEEQAKRQAELEREREIQRQQAELKKAPVTPKPETPASSPPTRQPEIKKPVTSEPVSPLSSELSQNRYTIAPAPKPLLKPADAKTLEQLLRFVVEGEQDKAEELIKKDKSLLFHAGAVKDLSGREFKQITAFQYALWAMDYHMWTMIQKYLPKELQAEQLQALESKGTTHGKHFSLQELTDALQVYVDNAAKWNYDQRAVDQWCKKVGGAQTRLPAHVVNEYCRADRPFEPCPSEWESKLPRSRVVPAIWDSTQSKYIHGSWFIAPSSKDNLGLNFAFLRGWVSGPPARCWGDGIGRGGTVGAGRGGIAALDLKALQSLWKTRTQQLELLRSQLLSVVNQSQVYGR